MENKQKKGFFESNIMMPLLRFDPKRTDGPG